jgi:hypothetical protein
MAKPPMTEVHPQQGQSQNIPGNTIGSVGPVLLQRSLNLATVPLTLGNTTVKTRLRLSALSSRNRFEKILHNETLVYLPTPLEGEGWGGGELRDVALSGKWAGTGEVINKTRLRRNHLTWQNQQHLNNCAYTYN